MATQVEIRVVSGKHSYRDAEGKRVHVSAGGTFYGSPRLLETFAGKLEKVVGQPGRKPKAKAQKGGEINPASLVVNPQQGQGTSSNGHNSAEGAE